MRANVEMGQTGYCIRMQTEDGAAYWQTGNESSKDKEPSLNIGEPLVMSPDHFQLGTAIVVMEPNGGIADAEAAGLVGEAGLAGPAPYRCTGCERLEEAESFIRGEGYRRCDSVACNCGGWHAARHNAEVAERRDARIDELLHERDALAQRLREYEHEVMTGRSEQHEMMVLQRDSLADRLAKLSVAARELADSVTCRPGCTAHGGDECSCGLEKLTTAVYDAAPNGGA